MARRTARQIAASRRNIVAAQRASAASRRGKSRSKKTGHHYGTGKTGRRQARINKYGSRKHGISIAQQTRRDRRSRRRKNAAAVAFSVATTGAALYGNYHSSTTASQRAGHRRKVKQASNDFAKRGKQTKMVYKMHRQMGQSRAGSARNTGRYVGGARRGKY